VFQDGVRRLLQCLPLLAVLALVVGAEPAAAWMPKPVQFERPVALDAAASVARAAGARPITAAIRTGRRFDLVGVEWRGARSLHIVVRARSHSGRWSRWGEAETDGDGPDPSEASDGARHLSAPVWAGGSDRVQLRLSRRVRSLRLRLINTTGTATARDRARTAKRIESSGQPGTLPLPDTHAKVPSIVPRSAWGASRCKPRDTPSYGRVQMGFVHHTVSLNGYSRSQAASVVLGVCLFHRNGRGWDDIGYNFLVDRFGRVFEGRAGGIDQPVQGAQAGGFNHGSTGVSLIGNFTSRRPSRAAMSALAKLLAWKLGLHGVPATGTTTVVSAGGPSTSYRAGRPVKLRRISGHRDADLTACPGAALYRLLPSLRRRVAALEGPVSALAFTPWADRVVPGEPFGVSGTLTLPDGVPGAGQPIEIRALAGGRENVVATATTGPDGAFIATVPSLTRTSVLRAVFAGGGDARPGVVSPVAYVIVAPAR
jgi:hypothetical protein